MSKRLISPVELILICSVSALAQTEGYDSRSFARLSFISGEAHIQRAGDMGYEAGTVNLVLVEGDRLATQNGRAEVNFGRMNVLRLDGFSQVEFVNLPRGDGEPFKLHLFSGSLYLRVSRLSSEKEFEVHTPDASLYVLTEGVFRVDVLENRQTRFSAIEGEAETAGEERSFTLRPGQSSTALDGRFLSGPESFSASLDEFDRWSRSRDGLMARNRSSSSYLPEELSEYESELSENGQWRYEADYGYVWMPRVRYYDDWRPYSYGRWVWYPVIGWTWVPDEQWGWCVYHYGRWHWSLALGWYWIPTRYWGPAWVHWYWDHDYVGWCALNRWNRPTVVINNRFIINTGRSDISVHNRAMVVVSRRQLQAPRIASVALRGDDLNHIGSVTLGPRQPSIAPAVSRSGRLPAEASRTFDLSRGRGVERTFGGRDDVAQRERRFPDGQRAIRSSESAQDILPRTSRGRLGMTPRSDEGRISRGEPSVRTRGGIREYALPGRASDDPGRAGRHRADSSDGPVRATSRIRSYEPQSGRTGGNPISGTPPAERLLRRESPSRSSSRIMTPDRSVSSGRQGESSFLNPGERPRNPASRSRSGWPSSSVDSRTRSSRGSAGMSSRSYSTPSYTRPSFDLSTSGPQHSSSARTYSSGRSSQPRSRFSSPEGSRSTSRSFSPSRSSGGSSSSVSAHSRFSGSASRSQSSSGSSAASRSSRSSRRR